VAGDASIEKTYPRETKASLGDGPGRVATKKEGKPQVTLCPIGLRRKGKGGVLADRGSPVSSSRERRYHMPTKQGGDEPFQERKSWDKGLLSEPESDRRGYGGG